MIAPSVRPPQPLKRKGPIGIDSFPAADRREADDVVAGCSPLMSGQAVQLKSNRHRFIGPNHVIKGLEWRKPNQCPTTGADTEQAVKLGPPLLYVKSERTLQKLLSAIRVK
ncbi:hypothetical protein E4U59_002471 [Claviceps monticola]|nr:hypothetical protein E4U59_002471 [Claviceps monticola]